ncbi:MAG: ABC transporter ATP-binding protein [Pseudomonadota bacterium]
MLCIRQLCVSYGDTQIIRDIDLELAKDEILMLLGPTGCGKTTVLQTVAGLVPMDSGEIQLQSWRATPRQSVPPEKRRVGMVFQDFALFPHLTVEENVRFRLSDPAPADHWLELLGLSDLRHAQPARLSGGQKQRVALARALAHSPALMLLDEPLSSLDAALKDSLRWDIRNALKAAGVPALWVTHDQGEAMAVGDRIAILNKGQLAQIGTPEQCYRRPANRFVARFLGDASFISGTRSAGRVSTALGELSIRAHDGADGVLEVLLRPNDCVITPAESGGNAVITLAQFEGGSWLYTTTLDCGTEVRVRTHHTQTLQAGSRVSVSVDCTSTFTAFVIN